MSERTTLCLVNCSGQDIPHVQVVKEVGFETGQAPSGILHNYLANNGALCGYVELDADVCTYEVELTFEDGTTLVFTDDQQNAKTKHVGTIAHSGTAKHVEVWRSSGGDIGSVSHGTNGIYIRRLPQPDHSGWMGALQTLKPDIRINDLVMPGSHDAGMYITEDYPLGGGGSWAKTQHLSILGQLQAGSRYFDLRLCMHDGHLRTYHGETAYGAYGASLDAILSDVRTFLRSPSGKKEVVFLKFSHSYKNAVERTVEVVKNLGDLLYKYTSGNTPMNPATMKLSDLQGKVVAVFDQEFEDYWKPDAGIFPYFDVDSRPSGTSSYSLYVYDQYANDGTYEKMAADQEHKLHNYGGLGQPFLFLLSWTLTGGGAVSDIEVLAGMANPWLPLELAAARMNHPLPNIAYIDFIDPWLGGAIIEANN